MYWLKDEWCKIPFQLMSPADFNNMGKTEVTEYTLHVAVSKADRCRSIHPPSCKIYHSLKFNFKSY